MKNRKFNKKESYSGKWCLYKEYYSREYTSIYVIAVSDGIVKYVYENNPSVVYYDDIDEFENYSTFFINPIQTYAPEICRNESTSNSNGNIGEYYIDDKISYSDCNHEWSHSDLMSYPPIHTRKCVKCGKEEYIPQGCSNPDGWVEGKGY